MGESFMGFPNRIQAYGSKDTDFNYDLSYSNSQLFPTEIDKKYDPNHALSSYYGYLISQLYLNRCGGMEFAMSGTLYTTNILPRVGWSSGGHPPDIGSKSNPFHRLYVQEIVGGTSGSSSTLTTPRTIKVSLEKTSNDRLYSGEAEFDGSKDIDINVWAPFLHINGGTINGAVTIGGTLTCNNNVVMKNLTYSGSIYPNITNAVPDESGAVTTSYTIGNSGNFYKGVYAREFHGELDGNADTASRFKIPVKITVDVDSTYTNKGSAILEGDEGDGIHYPDSVSESNQNLYQGVTIKTAANGYLPLTGGTITGNLSVGGKLSGKFTGEASTTYTVTNNVTGEDYLAYKTLGFELDIPHIRTYPYKGSYVSIDRYGDPLDNSNLGNDGQVIDAYIDDIATDALIAAAGCKPGGSGTHKDINVYANALTVTEVENAYYDEAFHVSKYSTKSSGLRRGAIIGGSMVSNIICAGNSDENIVYPAEYDYWTPNPIEGNYKTKTTLSNYCSSNKRNLDIYSRFVCFRSYVSSSVYDKCSIYSKNNGDGTYSGKESHSFFGSNSPVFNAHRTGGDDLWTGVEIFSGSSDSNAHVYVAGKVKALASTASTYETLSDIRYKSNIVTIDRDSSIDNISKVIPVSYIKNGQKEIGMVAQQVKESLWDTGASSYFCKHDDECDYLTLNYPAFIPDLINTCQYLLSKVDNLEVLAGIKESLEFPGLQNTSTFNESYYRDNAEKLAKM